MIETLLSGVVIALAIVVASRALRKIDIQVRIVHELPPIELSPLDLTFRHEYPTPPDPRSALEKVEEEEREPRPRVPRRERDKIPATEL